MTCCKLCDNVTKIYRFTWEAYFTHKHIAMRKKKKTEQHLQKYRKQTIQYLFYLKVSLYI